MVNGHRLDGGSALDILLNEMAKCSILIGYLKAGTKSPLCVIERSWLPELVLGLLEALTASEEGDNIATIVDMENHTLVLNRRTRKCSLTRNLNSINE